MKVEITAVELGPPQMEDETMIRHGTPVLDGCIDITPPTSLLSTTTNPPTMNGTLISAQSLLAIDLVMKNVNAVVAVAAQLTRRLTVSANALIRAIHPALP
ncbi:hypothetical protein MHU86_17854 [Fragilaria crotonensis]|nr:hypothetical protein MHU86_17854 [Fragilaria crotonensis]